MFKTLSFLTLIICVLSIFIFNNVSFAGDVSDYAYKQLNIRYKDVKDKETALGAVRTVLGDLNSGWDDEIANMTSNEEVALITGVGAVISSLVAAASGGSLVPAMYAAWVSKYKSKKAETHRIASADYLTAMSSSLSQLDAALAAIETSYTLYSAQHDTYLGVMAPHLGRVKSSLATASSAGQTSFSHTGNTSGDPHSVDKLWGRDHWDMDDLPKSYACKSGNPCMYSYRTPYEALTAHQWTCGSDYSIVSHRVPGCGKKYYKCPNYEIPDYHNTFSCTRYNMVFKAGESGRVREYCGTHFRYCTNFTYDSQGHVATITSAGQCSKLLGAGQSGSHNHSNSDDTDTSPGNFRQQEVTETTITYACDDHSGVASGASGHVAAGCGNPNHFICDNSDHSASSCGHIDHFNCDGKTHQQVQCTETNDAGDQCTYTYWACANDSTPTHNHAYPAISCGRSGCTQTVSSSTAHQVTCSAGHQYWSCGQYANWHANHHRTRTCRFGRCGQSWQRCSRPSSAPTPMCTDPTRAGQRCWAK
ncbi:MAG: hypothetical protein OXM61_12035 [Candidatus Poribacteria bacterium]|nr:hypothetical protein [Candidatus Poribacteria bacterium]